MLLDAPPKSPRAPEPEALIEEARGRQRRRRRGIALAVLALAAVAVAAFLVFDRSSTPAINGVPNGPVVNLRAFSGHGRLALVSRGVLYAVSGSHVRMLPRHEGYLVPANPTQLSPAGKWGYFAPVDPQLSPDGKWLAYLETNPTGLTPSQLWLARGDGTDAQEIPVPTPEQIIGWRSDTLAILAGPEHTKMPCPCFLPTTIRLVSPNGSSRVIARAPSIYGAAWSPAGTAIAYDDDDIRTNRIESVPASGGRPTVWWTQAGVGMEVAGWWRRGIGFWSYPFGSNRNNDVTPLSVVARPGALPRELAGTLSSGVTDTVSSSVTGQLAVVQAFRDPGRIAWTGKTLDLCATAGCTNESVAGTITVDPAWSPDGRTLVFAYAPDFGDLGPWRMQRVEAWFAGHRGELYNVRTRLVAPFPAVNGGTSFNWSRDGKSLLFVKGNAVWLLPSLDAKAIRIAGPIYPAGRWPQYYAQVDWAHQFSWAD